MYSDEDIAQAEKILKDCFTASLVAGDQRGIHERLARILPPGAYTLCNLLRGTETPPPRQAGPSGYHRRGLPRGQSTRGRPTPYGATRQATPPIPTAFLTTDQREELLQLAEEKGKQLLARATAREANNLIIQGEKRLATLADLNRQQAELDLKRATLQRSTRSAVQLQASSLTPLLPALSIMLPEPNSLQIFNGKEISDKTSQRMKDLFEPLPPIPGTDLLTEQIELK